jgi:probable F420-dependent oxidoreductase
MHIGVYNFATDYSMPIDELARALEERRFESLFLPEHTHIPASRRSPWAGGSELPKEYWHTLDPFVALAIAAAATTHLKLGTGICLVTERDPIVTAKSVATLDLLSKGRFLFGIGAGWNAEEMENHGTEFDSRFRLMSERVQAMKAIWTEEEASFHGDFVDFDSIWCHPKPYQKPHPPILLGGESQYTLQRIAEFCDGWFPRGRGGFDPVSKLDTLKALFEQAGRDISELSVTVFGARAEREVLDYYRAAGITRVLFVLPSAGREVILPKLDEYAALMS